jgi:citrate lyase subunit beta / citryl-CoA lyase
MHANSSPGCARRSLIYVPGDSERMLLKAPGLPADVLVLNLEDGIAASMKEKARGNVHRFLSETDLTGHEVVVRVNDLSTQTGREDLAAVIPGNPGGICLPKVDDARQVREASRMMRDLESSCGLPEGGIRLHAMIESARGVLRAEEIAAADPRMAALVFGSADFAADAGCIPGEDRAEILLALQAMVLAARASGLDAIDGPCFDLKNPDLLRREALQARRLGFDGKSALHPGQLAVIHEVFDVTPGEIAWAERVISELDAAEERGRALTTIGSRLVDNPHRRAAERILRRRRPHS